VTELHEGERGRAARFECRHGFAREDEHEIALPGGVLLREPGFRVRAAVLDHGIPCLAFALEESRHISVRKEALAALGLRTGRWLKGLKLAVLDEAPDDTPIPLDDGQSMPLGQLREAIIDQEPGRKLAYVVDARFTPANQARIIDLARGADELYIESAFSAADAEQAARKLHLTGEQAAWLARQAGAKRLIPVHCSPRYKDKPGDPVAEALRAFAGTLAS